MIYLIKPTSQFHKRGGQIPNSGAVGNSIYDESKRVRPISTKPLDNDSLFALQHAYNEVAEKTISAVVSLRVETETVVNNPLANDEFLRRFFGIPNTPQRRKAEAFGSGFLVSSDGFLISNNHVVEGATKITIIFKDIDKEYTAKIVGTDKDTDIALLKIEGDNESFPFLKLADSEQVKIGDIVVAIGNPFGLSHTFTTGVISAKGRTGVIGNRYENFIQTDVAINRGNSGGPLINLYGEVVGINSAILSPTGGSIGIGFSIPINMAKSILNELKNTGRVARGWLGVNFEEIDSELAEALSISKNGIVVTRVIENSPAASGDIQAGDIMTHFNGEVIKGGRDLINKIGQIKIGTTVTIDLLRDGKKITTRIKILERDENLIAENSGQAPSQPQENSSKFFGIEVANMSQNLLEEYNVSQPIGVQVINISRESPLAQKGLRNGDIIKSINKKPTLNLRQYSDVASDIKAGQKVLFTVQRERAVFYLVISL